MKESSIDSANTMIQSRISDDESHLKSELATEIEVAVPTDVEDGVENSLR